MTHGPELLHAKPLLGALELHLNHLLLNVVVPGRGNVGDCASGSRGEHDAMLHERVFKHNSVNVSGRDSVADLECGWVELPLLSDVQGRDCDSPWDEAVSTCHCNGLEGALDSIEDVVEDARAELDGEWLLCS